MSKNKIKTQDELIPIVEDLKSKGKKIVTTNGVFDILHIGHTRYLQKSKALGDVLVVLVNSDSSVKLNKDPNRPYNNENNRVEVLAALECVDYIVMFSGKTPIEVLSKIKPNVHTKGADYTVDQMPEREIVEKNGGEIALVSLEKGFSTTSLIEKIINSNKN